jgi:hypothetical protein
MRILLYGSSGESFTAALDAAGIKYERHTPQAGSGVALNSWYDVLQFVEHAIPWAAFAMVAVAWIKAKAAREINVTTKDGRTRHTKGLSVEEFERVLEDAEEIEVIDEDTK